MNQTFEAQFGDFSIATQQARVTQSPTEENEFFVLLFDLECDIKNFLMHTNPLPKGRVSIKSYVKLPPKCPNCQHELTNMGLINYRLQEVDRYDYNGVSATVIPSYNEDIMELKLRYETMEYKACYPKEKNLIDF